MEFSPMAYNMPSSLRPIAMVMRLDQRWDMFSPRPPKEDGWYVIPGKLRDGSVVDIYRNGRPVSYERPGYIALTYDGERWRKYLMNIWNKDYEDYRLYYGQYLCRQWNRSHPYSQHLLTFDIIFMLEPTLLDLQETSAEPVTIWQHSCF